MRPKSSLIWRYFVVAEDGLNAKCKLCLKIYSRKGRSTSPMKGHLKSMHLEHFIVFEKLTQIMQMLVFTDDDGQKDDIKKLQVWKEFQDEIEPTLLTENAEVGLSEEFLKNIKERFEEKCKQYKEPEILQTQGKKMSQKNLVYDPLAIKIERSEVSIELENEENDLAVEYSSSDDDLNLLETNCSSSRNIATKRKINSTEELSGKEDLVEAKCDGIDLMFLGYAAALKKMTPRRQIMVKYEIAKLFMEAELSELE